MPPAASTPPCPVPGPNNSPGLILGLGLGLGGSLALLPSAQAASITQTVLRSRGTTICPRLCPYDPFSGPTPSSLGLQDLVSHGQEEGSPRLLVETGAGPGLRWPSVLADVLLLQRPPCWLLEPTHGTSNSPIQNHPDAVASLNRKVSFGVTAPSPLPNAHDPRLHLFLHCLPGKGLPQCTGQPVVREATLVSLLRGDATSPLSTTAITL